MRESVEWIISPKYPTPISSRGRDKYPSQRDRNNWIGWNYKSRADEIVELVLDEVNDMLKKNKIKINYQYNDDNEEGWDYFLELDKEDICQ